MSDAKKPVTQTTESNSGDNDDGPKLAGYRKSGDGNRSDKSNKS